MGAKPRFVLVEWWDIVSDSAWVGEAAFPAPALHETYGWLVRDAKKAKPPHIVIAATRATGEIDGEGQQYGETIAIPTGCIKRVKSVRTR